MVQFNTPYYTPMDRKYHERMESGAARPAANIEEPIIPIGRLGQTVPEQGRTQNIVQNVQAAIRGGTGSMQIVFETPIESAIGGRPKAYGEEVRQAIRELALANEVAVTGMEMPTSLTNMSGWDERQGVVSEEKRRRDLDEVKEMIRFAAEVGQGGGVDIVSWEYDRPIHRAEWLKKDKVAQKAFKATIADENEKEVMRFVDRRSGQIGTIPIRDGIPMFKDKKNYKEIDPLVGQPVLWKHEDFENYAESKGLQVHEVIKEFFLDEQVHAANAQVAHYMRQHEIASREFRDAQNAAEEAKREGLSEKELKKVNDRLKMIENEVRYFKDGVQEQKRIAMQAEERKNNWVSMEKFTLDRSQQSYAEAGIEAMHLQNSGKFKLQRDLAVGPELGWPQFFGSHPEEFKKVIMGAREQMVGMLTHKDTAKALGVDVMSRKEAEAAAERHIKGTFDTSHFGMWLQNFHPEMPWHKRIEKFKDWYGDWMDKLAKENKKHNLISAIQAVDSAGAAHGHLPPGQGILPVKEAVETLQKKGGFRGYVLSEGHEEEKFGQGRILLKNWQEFNSPFGKGYHSQPTQQRWGEVQNAYFGRTYSPNFMFGAYAPSNEFKLWSEIPLE